MSPQDPRPAFHFTAAAGWINDPLGVTWKDGRYHLFYQYVPGRNTWASNCHWGHATSGDMISWAEQDVAVAPGDGDDGVWSGSIVTDAGGKTTMFYTSVSEPDIGIGTVRTATPDDAEWKTWTKGAKLMTAPDLGIVAYRDPFVFRDGELWRMFVGAGLDGGTAAAVSYSSRDLVAWTLDGLAALRSGKDTAPVWTGTMWECPQLFEIDGSHVLVTSIWEDDVLHHVAYGVGHYADGKFEARSWGQLSYGKGYYAPSFFRDKDGAPSLIFWVRGVISPDGQWASALSIPHTLSLDGDMLVATPHQDLEEYLRPAQLERISAASFETVLVDGADIRCTVGSGTVIRLECLGEVLVALRHDGSALTVIAGAHPDFAETGFPVPAGSEVRVVIDAGILEISAREGIMAVPLPIVINPVTLTVAEPVGVPELKFIVREGGLEDADLRGAGTSLPYLLS